MTPAPSNRVEQDLGKLCSDLIDKVRSGVGKKEGMVRFEVPVLQDVDVLRWLDAHPEWPKGYLASRGGGEEIAGVGAAHVVAGGSVEDFHKVLEEIHEHLPSEPGARYYGGLRFDRGMPDDPDWMNFFGYGFVLPRVEISRRGDEQFLACHVNMSDAGEVERIIDYLGQSHWTDRDRKGVLPTIESRRDEPDHATWNEAVIRAKALVRDGELEKVVLARKSTFSFSSSYDPLWLLERLKQATPSCFHFCLMPHEDIAFVAASPERLYLRRGKHVESEAIAGTRPRVSGDAEDRALGEELLSSDKDLREHDYVVRGIQSALAELVDALDQDAAPSLLKLARGQHLVTRFSGTLKDGVSDGDLLEALHPTPAMGGFPRDRALNAISELECFDRGWYTGPLGWVSGDGADMTVAIRCGLASKQSLSLFSGAGIVDASEPEAEWQEIENKISDFIRLLSEE